jgi:hypothetical protein
MNDNMDQIGQVSDSIENLLFSLNLPIPPELHLKALKESLPELKKKLREAVIAETGENPWDEA